MNKIFRYFLLLLIPSTGLVSCKKFIEEKSFNLSYPVNLDDLDKLLLGDGYFKVFSKSTSYKNANYYFPFIHFISDETREVHRDYKNPSLNSPDIRDDIFGFYTWQQNLGGNHAGTKITDDSDTWLNLYRHIAVANSTLDQVETLKESGTIEQYERIRAESYFVRASSYFLLANLYAQPYQAGRASQVDGVPLKTTSQVEDVRFTRNNLEEVYARVLSDLDQAEDIFKRVPDKKSKYRASLMAVYLLKSRVFLYQQSYQQSAVYAQKVISDQKSNFLLDLRTFHQGTAGYLQATSPEVIFSMGGVSSYTHLSEGGKGLVIDPSLLDLFSDQDLRKGLFFEEKTFQERNLTEMITGKYIALNKFNRSLTRGDVSDVFNLRVSEAYLNAVEALFMNGQISEAKNVLNTFLQTRYRSVLDLNTLSEQELSLFIINERRKELCFEGHRWFDLRRYMVRSSYAYSKTLRQTFTTYQLNGAPTGVLQLWTPAMTYVYELSPEPARYTLPIPASVVQKEPGIINNHRGENEPKEIITY